MTVEGGGGQELRQVLRPPVLLLPTAGQTSLHRQGDSHDDTPLCTLISFVSLLPLSPKHPLTPLSALSLLYSTLLLTFLYVIYLCL